MNEVAQSPLGPLWAVRITLTGPARLCRWSRLVVSFLNSTARTRLDQTHGPLPRTQSGRRLFRLISTCTDFVGGSGLVGSVHVVEFGKDTVGPDQRQSVVGPAPNSTRRTQIRPDQTQSPRTCRRADPGLRRSLVGPAWWNLDVARNAEPTRVATAINGCLL